MSQQAPRVLWLLCTVALVGSLLWLDSTRGGPATELSQCNLALTRSAEPAADVLVLGSSRTGVAIDPVAMEAMLQSAGIGEPTVERVALARNPLRANVAMLDNYLSNRGTPKLIVFEISFLTDRSVKRIDALRSGVSADEFLYRRDVNLLDYGQIASTPAVARPFTESESAINRARFGLGGLITRTGALTYQAAQAPLTNFDAQACDKQAWTRESEWPADFAFSWDDATEVGAPEERVATLRAQIEEDGPGRELQPWQEETVERRYPYDVDEPYRAGEMELLGQAVAQAAEHGVPVVLIPMTLYGTTPDPGDLREFDQRFEGDAVVYDLYGAIDVDLSTYWYDDAHLLVGDATELATAVLAQYLLDEGSLSGESSIRAGR